MAWYDGGNGAGVWEGLPLSPTLKNVLHELCTAVNEREMFRASNSATVSSITRSGSTATVTTASAHALTTGDKVYMCGADQSAYNGVVTVTVTGSTTFTYTVSGSPATPATGTLRCRRPLTKFVYNDSGDTKYFPAVSDFVDLPLSKIANGPSRALYDSVTPTSVTSSGGIATVTTTSAFVAKLNVGDPIEALGADQAEYNVIATVLSKPSSTTFTYAISGAPASPATGTITVRHYNRVTRSGATVTVRLPGHGLMVGDVATLANANQSEYNSAHIVTQSGADMGTLVSITRSGSTATVTFDQAHGMLVGELFDVSGCAESEYNGLKTVATVPSSTTFTYSVSGTPSTPASGTPQVLDRTRFEFEITGTPSSPATGDLQLATNRHMVTYATRSGSTATFTCQEHGFATGDYVEALGSGATPDGWAFYGPITVTNANTFTATITGTPTSPWAPSVLGTLAVTKEGEFRKVLRQLQTAIAALLTASTSTGVIRFVEDSAPYETNYTLANLLGAGSYGSAWVSLHKLPRASLNDVLDQMREAVDLLVVQTVTGTAATSGTVARGVNETKFRGGTASGDGTTITVNTTSAHGLTTGDTVWAWVTTPGGISDEEYECDVTVVDSDTLTIPGTKTVISGVYLWYPIAVGTAWSDAIDAISDVTKAVENISLRKGFFDNIGVSVPFIGDYFHDVFEVTLFTERESVFSITSMLGTFVTGEIYLLESNNGDVTQDTYVLTDSDADTADIDATIGTTDSLITVSKTSTFFDTASKTLTFTTPTPASHPFSSSLASEEETIRSVAVREALASKHTRELVTGTHLTYG